MGGVELAIVFCFYLLFCMNSVSVSKGIVYVCLKWAYGHCEEKSTLKE